MITIIFGFPALPVCAAPAAAKAGTCDSHARLLTFSSAILRSMRYAPAFVFSIFALHMDAQEQIPIKVAVVAIFERAADTGDHQGKYQYSAQREKLYRVISFPLGSP